MGKLQESRSEARQLSELRETMADIRFALSGEERFEDDMPTEAIAQYRMGELRRAQALLETEKLRGEATGDLRVQAEATGAVESCCDGGDMSGIGGAASACCSVSGTVSVDAEQVDQGYQTDHGEPMCPQTLPAAVMTLVDRMDRLEIRLERWEDMG